jgi:signal transduction histidine kinase
MEPLAILIPLGPVVVLGFFYLRRIAEGHGAAQWAWAWLALWMAGALQAIGGRPAIAVANACGALFMAFILAGTMEFRGRRPPRWLLPACGGFGLLRFALAWSGMPQLSYLVAAPYELLLGAAAYRQVRLAPAEFARQPSHLLLGPALFGLAALDVVDVTLRALGQSVEAVVPVWIAGSFATVLIQIVAVVDRLRLAELRGREERERLSGVIEGERRTLRAVLDAAPVGVFLMDRDWRMQVMNRNGAEQFEIEPPEEWLGRPGVDAVAKWLERVDRPDACFAALRAAALDPTAVLDSLELRFVRPSERVLSIFSSPVRGEDGEYIGRVFTSRDVTAESQLETELRQVHKMETLGTLAGGIAHDFNNQLTAILGNCRFALDALPEDHEAGAALHDLARAAEHCADLTRSLLAFARRAPLEPRASDVVRVVREVERVLRATLPSWVRFELALEPDLQPALVDPTQLQQVLLNLCVNARDALPAEGSILLGVRNRTLGEAEARELGVASHACVELRVCDDGVGMDERTRARAFDPFFTTKPVGSGTGLGLAVVYGLVRGHGGWIGVESEPGRGSTFRVLLPVAAESPRDADLPPDAAPAARGELLLVAEDEAAVRRVACGALRRAGYRVIEAVDGAEALDQLRARGAEIDLAVLDLSMPRLDGLAALREMRRLRPDLRVLLVSGRFPTELGSPPEDAEVLAKPFEPAELAARVRALLDRRERPEPGARAAGQRSSSRP